ncbi:Actin-depolymerizing factor 2 [Linum perenne]
MKLRLSIKIYQFRYVVFKINERRTGSPAESYDDFTAFVPENDYCYTFYDYVFVTSEALTTAKRARSSSSPGTLFLI